MSAISSSTLWLLDILEQFPWHQTVVKAWKYIQKLLARYGMQGVYEVLEHESTLELLDRGGHRARFQKRQVVRYLQDGIIAFQDQAWGDGEILLDYQCSPGVAVDFYRPGRKTYVLISLRGVKNRGDVDEHNMQWGIRDGFLRTDELWETEISHQTQLLKVRVIFPQRRPPLQAALVEDFRRVETPLGEMYRRQLPDGRWEVEKEIRQPRLHERYGLRWVW